MTLIAFLGAVAGRLTTPTVPTDERAGAEILNGTDLTEEFGALLTQPGE
jgi:hypothetical protein